LDSFYFAELDLGNMLLPEFTANARLCTLSTAMAPGMVTLVGVVKVQPVVHPVATPF